MIDRAQDVSPKLPGDLAQKATHRTLRVVSYVIHVFLNCFQAIVFHNYKKINRHAYSIGKKHTLVDQLDALVVGSNLLETQSMFSTTHYVFRLTAFKSLSTSRIFLHPELPGYLAGFSTMYSYSPFLSNTPSFTSFKLTISAPSSNMFTEVGGIDPGRIPPMSAWWPRDAVKKMIFPDCGSNTGLIMVMSGRCLPKTCRQ